MLDRIITFGAWTSGGLLLIMLLVGGYIYFASNQSSSVSPQELMQLRQLERQYKVDPADFSIAIALADSYSRQGDAEKAEVTLLRAERAAERGRRTSTPVFVALGILYWDTGKKQSAERYFRRAVAADRSTRYFQLDRYIAEARYRLGLIEASRGKCAAAIPHFQKALGVNPSDADILYRLGQCQRLTGQARGALVSLKSAMRLVPSYPEVERELRLLGYEGSSRDSASSAGVHGE